MADDQIIGILRKLGVPRRFWGARLENFQIRQEGQRRVVEELRVLINAGESGFGMFGGTGRGKTRLLCSAAAEMARRHPGMFREDGQGRIKTARYIYAPDFLIAVQETYRGNSETGKKEIYDSYSGLQVIFLDDFAADSITEDFRKHWSYLFNQWFEREALFFMTSNLHLNDIAKIDDRIASRIEFMTRGNAADVGEWERWGYYK